MTTKTKTWAWVGLIVILLLVWYALNRHSSKPSTPVQTTTTTTTTSASKVPLTVTETQVPITQAPTGFPSDIPIEKGAQITQNYNATAQNGLVQATRTFITKQTLDQNFTLYTNYLKTSGWTVVNSLDLSTTKVLSAKKGSANLQITISQNSITKVNTVDISYSS